MHAVLEADTRLAYAGDPEALDEALAYLEDDLELDDLPASGGRVVPLNDPNRAAALELLAGGADS